jgi:hypothetical protein
MILLWVDRFHRRTGRWPKLTDGAIPGAGGETWLRVNAALFHGHRGLPGGSTLAGLLAERRGVRNRMALPPLSVRDILAWADSFRARTGHWPTSRSGPIPEPPENTWACVQAALSGGGARPARRLLVGATAGGAPPPPQRQAADPPE